MKYQLHFTLFLIISLIINYFIILPYNQNMYYAIMGLILGFIMVKQHLTHMKIK